MPVAYTEIRHGNDDGTIVTINEGDEVKGLPKEVVEQLKEDGIVGDAPSQEKTDDLNEEVEQLSEENDDLKAQVAELKKQLAAAKTPSK